MSDRAFDIILFGATGFTGQRTAREIATRVEGGALRWAIAGRNHARLTAVRSELARSVPSIAAVPILIADANDAREMMGLAAQARVLISTVGPYRDHGLNVVEACVEGRTDYVDITGEVPFWRETVRQFHTRAQAQQVLIVSCCGFESIPFDLGVQFTADQCPHAKHLKIRAYIEADGGLSGGTIRSGIQAMSDIKTWQDLVRPTQGRARFHRSPFGDRWALPFASIDAGVVQRTVALSGSNGPRIEYEHYFTVPRLLSAASWTARIGIVTAMAQVSPVRRWLLRRFPSGTGPSDQRIAEGRFCVRFEATLDGREQVHTEVRGADPGYGHTAVMLAEAALTLALDRSDLPARGGVLTPALAMGHVLRRRLERSGMSFRRV